MSQVSVSVVIPTRNRSQRLAVAVRSALAQTVRDLEVVVVDDASDDDTPAVLATLEGEDPRVRGIRAVERGGASRARNMGAEHASGDLLAFLDDDCVWAPDKLEAQRRAMSDGAGACYTRQATLDVDGRWIVEGEALPEASQIDGLLRTNFVGTPSLVVRRGLFLEVGGFDETLPRLQDWDLALRLAARTRLAYVPRVMVRSALVPGGISTSPGLLERAAARIIERHAPGLTRRQAAALHYGLAKFLLVDGERCPALAMFAAATRLHPTSPAHWAGLAAGLLGPAPARLVRSLRRTRALRRLDPDAAEALDGAWPGARP